MQSTGTQTSHGVLEGLVEAMVNKNSQVDIALKRLTISLPAVNMSAELNGNLTVTITTRDLTEEERVALARKNAELPA